MPESTHSEEDYARLKIAHDERVAEVTRLTNALQDVAIDLAQAQDAMHGQDYDAVDEVRETIRKHLKQSTK